jgi:hypothetical protein
MDSKVGRLEQFKQIKASVRGSENILLVGIDVAKNSHHAFFARIWSLTTVSRGLRLSDA